MKAWNVYLNGEVIDTVFYDDDVEADEVKRGLVDHDGYDPAIEVREGGMRWGRPLVRHLEAAILEIDKIHKAATDEMNWGQWGDLKAQLIAFIEEYKQHFPLTKFMAQPTIIVEAGNSSEAWDVINAMMDKIAGDAVEIRVGRPEKLLECKV